MRLSRHFTCGTFTALHGLVMYVLCAWCRAEGKPCVLREIEPLGTPTATHGICDAHAASVLAKGRAAMGLPVESEQDVDGGGGSEVVSE